MDQGELRINLASVRIAGIPAEIRIVDLHNTEEEL
jgi:hypothetical protein